MNRREKILALAVAMLVLALVLNFGAARIARMFTELDDTKTKLEEDLKTKELMKHRGVVARRLLDVYQAAVPAERQDVGQLALSRLAVRVGRNRPISKPPM